MSLEVPPSQWDQGIRLDELVNFCGTVSLPLGRCGSGVVGGNGGNGRAGTFRGRVSEYAINPFLDRD